MKSILLSGTAAALLLAASGTSAQPDKHQNDTHAAGSTDTTDQHGATSGSDRMSSPAGQHNTATAAHTTTARANHGTTHRTTHVTNRAARVTNHTRVNNTMVHAKIDIGTYRRATPATHHFSIGEYHAPSGYTYRRYNVGERLEPNFYARDYWLTNWSAYDLMSPPDGYVWVRFGPDAILIDQSTGEVIQVQYGLFS